MFEKDLQRLRGAGAREELIRCIYEGSNLSEACAEMRLNPGALAMARREDGDLDQMIRDAQAFSLDRLVDKLEDIREVEDDAVMARVMSDNIKWLAAKRHREIYGEKVDVSHTHTINILDALAEAKARTIEHVGAKALEHKDNSTDNVSVALDVIDVECEEVDPLS